MISNNPTEIKQKLGQTTEQLEDKILGAFETYSPHYTSLEPWQRGLLLIALTLFLLFSLYFLTKKEKVSNEEEKILRHIALFKKLQK